MSVTGPPVRLGPNAAVTLNMTLRELATNAAKYGALSTPGGTVEVAWTVEEARAGPRVGGGNGNGNGSGGGEDDGGAIQLLWRERGGPPRRRGFGTRLIERGLAHELDGEARLDFAPAGIEYHARLPLSASVRVPT